MMCRMFVASYRHAVDACYSPGGDESIQPPWNSHGGGGPGAHRCGNSGFPIYVGVPFQSGVRGRGKGGARGGGDIDCGVMPS